MISTCDILRKIKFMGFVNIFMHFVDMASDLLYLIKVPKYNSFSAGPSSFS